MPLLYHLHYFSTDGTRGAQAGRKSGVPSLSRAGTAGSVSQLEMIVIQWRQIKSNPILFHYLQCIYITYKNAGIVIFHVCGDVYFPWFAVSEGMSGQILLVVCSRRTALKWLFVICDRCLDLQSFKAEKSCSHKYVEPNMHIIAAAFACSRGNLSRGINE